MTDTYLAAAGTIGTLIGLFTTHPHPEGPEVEPVPDVTFDNPLIAEEEDQSLELTEEKK